MKLKVGVGLRELGTGLEKSREGAAVGQRVLGAGSREKQKVTGGGPRGAGPLYS